MKTIIKLLSFLIFSSSVAAQSLDGFIGKFHRPNVWDLHYLDIRIDGKFTWHLDGCDYARGAEGTWKVMGEKILLLPNARESNNWPAMFLWKPSKKANEDGVAFYSEVVRTDGTTLVDSEGKLRPQPLNIWVKGGASAKCRDQVR